jgi:hypothetical protein
MVCDMRTPLGFPLREGVAVKREGFFEQLGIDDESGMKYIHYELVCTEHPLPRHLWHRVQEELSDGSDRALVPAKGCELFAPAYWYESDSQYAAHMIPFAHYGARALGLNESSLRAAVKEGRIPLHKNGAPWETI